MPATHALRRIAASSTAQQLASELLVDVNQVSSAGQFFELAMPKIVEASRASSGAVYRPEQGQWKQQFGTSQVRDFDTSLLAEALDGDQATAQDGWAVAPLVNHAERGECLLLNLPWAANRDARELVDALASLL